MEDPYKTLGVRRDASQDDIRRAYIKLAKKHHPDLNPGNAKAEERFKTVAAANELLSDAEKRGRFDRGEIDSSGQEQAPPPFYRDHAETATGRRYSPGGAPSGGWGSEEFGDLFGAMFHEERRAGGRREAGSRRGHDERYALETAFLDAVNGATRRLTLPDGRVLDVKIPPGTEEGAVLRLRGQGGAGQGGAGQGGAGQGGADRKGGAAGDALITIGVAPHRFFTRDGRTIRLELPVTLTEAVLGASVAVPTPGGPVRMRVPPHSDSGAEFRLRGRGVPASGGAAAGDLYATLRVVLGAPDAALEAFLRDWKPETPVDPRRTMEEPP